MRDVRDVREPPMSLATAAGRVRMGFGPRMAGQRPSGGLPAAYRADTADDQLASAGLHSATPVAPWTWLGAVRIEGDAGGGIARSESLAAEAEELDDEIRGMVAAVNEAPPTATEEEEDDDVPKEAFKGLRED